MVALLTLSVVLPCAYEYAFMERTAKSVWEMTPAERLEEIIIVDDASDPPLEHFAAAATYKVRFFTHDEPRGLIGAKKTGADAARGGIVVFFDCHAPDYWVPFVSHVEKNYKRVVVPTITNLDVDTWTEFGRPPPGTEGMSKCYLTFDGEFKWTKDDTEFVPVTSRVEIRLQCVMSGGLLAMSRRWWKETGGYDDAMRGWGGENIDQSLRIWRCGGEIVSATRSYVAHMWRDAAKPATRSKYRVPPNAKATNIARAGKAHMGGWYGAKLLSFDLCFDPFVQFKASNKPWEPHNGVNATAIESRMATCNDGAPAASFEWYLRRFKYVYRDGGVLPAKTFQLRHEASGLCLGLAGRTWGSAAKPRDTGDDPKQGRTTAKVLALSEPTYAARPDYIEAVQKHGMVVDWRLKIVAWFDQLGDAFDMKPETIAMATNYLDRYLSRRSCGGVNLQLAATASIFLASKVEEQRPFGPPRAPRRRGADAGDAAELEDRAVAYADRSRSDLAFLAFPPSMIAVAAVLCALRARRADPARTEAFLAVVKAAELPCASAPRAAERIRACGVLLLGLDEEVVALDDDDLEVEAYADQTHPLLYSDSEEDLEENHAPSPTDVMDTGRIADFRSPSPLKRHKSDTWG
ncbi:N-acetylgalactosaminyltransferase 7 [Aureococcus anophagefferens]|nr:N-acetylgalactosaminyltransferase 7 [Aureococcus anophagefferens]